MNRMTIWFTSDTHGYLYDTDFASREPRDVGLLGFDFPRDENTLVIDGGDTIQGSPLTYFCDHEGEALPIAGAMNALGYDYVTLGNHDFNGGPERLEAYLGELKARCLCANVADREGRLPVAPWAVHTLGNGTRVGLVGVVTDWVNLWEKPENLTRLSVSDPLAAAKRAVAQLREAGVDVLVGIYHGGVERDLDTGRRLSETNENIACRLCEELPFDLLLTGHQHMALPGAAWAGTWMVQPPANAEKYVRVSMDEEGRFSSELLPVPDRAELRPEEEALLKKVDAWLDQPVGHLSRPLWPKDHLSMALEGSGIAALFNQVQLHASGAQISCAALGNEVRGFDREVTVRDVVASYVYTNTLVVLRVTGRVLRQGLEQCASFFQVTPEGGLRVAAPFLEPKEAYYNYDYFAGVRYVFDLRKPVGERVVSLTMDSGEPVAPDESYTLCMCDYRATGSGDFDFYRDCPRVREIQTDISELILDAFRGCAEVDIPEESPYRVIR